MAPSRIILATLVAALLVISCEGNNFISNALGSNMVLQRAPQKARIWGWTLTAGAEVLLTIDGRRQNATYTTTSDSNLAWSVELQPALAGGPHTIWVSSSDGQIQILTNVMFGDVWVCGGQSNMEFVVSQSFNGSKYISYSDEYSDVRLFTVGQGTTSYDPLAEFATIEQPWTFSSPDSVGGPDYTRFSAVCWYFGINLYDYYLVPIGLVSSNWGGTYIQAWSSPDALAKCTNEDYKEEEEEPAAQEHFPAKYFAEETVAGNPNEPSVLWNSMIVPMIPMRVRGAIWYQGEANVGSAKAYACQFPAMIMDWREKWNEGPEMFGFHFVQLAPYSSGNTGKLPDMRLAQTDALNLPVVGFAVTTDLGDADSPYGAIHPRDKDDVGYRLFLNALYMTYHEEHITYLGPTVSSIVYNTSSAVVSFQEDTITTGLVLRKPVCPASLPAGSCAGAELLSADGNWHNATIKLDGNTAIFALEEGSNHKVLGARYGYADWPLAIIYGGNGLPAPPFYLHWA
jgi:sialate O-acetylesterase